MIFLIFVVKWYIVCGMKTRILYPEVSSITIEKLHHLEKSLRKDVGQRFRQARTHFDISQKKFSDRVSANQSTIANIERGKIYPNMIFIYRLIVEYKVNPVWLFTGDGDMFIQEGEKTPGIDIQGIHLDDTYINLIQSMKNNPAIEKIMLGKLAELNMLLSTK